MIHCFTVSLMELAVTPLLSSSSSASDFASSMPSWPIHTSERKYSFPYRLKIMSCRGGSLNTLPRNGRLRA